MPCQARAGLAYTEVAETPGGHDLTEGNPAVIWRDSLVPVGTEPSFPKARHGAFGEVPVLEAAAGEDDTLPTDVLGHGHNCVGEGIMELERDQRGDNFRVQIRQDALDQGGPVKFARGDG